MRITIATPVNQSAPQVMAGFTRNLFLKLAPPFPPVRLLRFDGCRRGDEVHLELNFLLFKQQWISDIIDAGDNAEEIYFVDRGRQLPFFLAQWQHRHRIVRRGQAATIVDDIMFKTPFWLFDYLTYPLLYAQFLYRKPIYRRTFA